MEDINFVFSWSPLFLAALLDALATGVERSLAAGLRSQLLSRLLICVTDVVSG